MDSNPPTPTPKKIEKADFERAMRDLERGDKAAAMELLGLDANAKVRAIAKPKRKKTGSKAKRKARRKAQRKNRR